MGEGCRHVCFGRGEGDDRMEVVASIVGIGGDGRGV